MRSAVALTAAASFAGLGVHASPSLTVSDTVKGTMSANMYSAFYETQFRYGGEGGLYAELVRNRDFEALGRGNLGDPDEPVSAPPGYEGAAAAAYIHDALMQRRAEQGLPTSAPGLDPHEPPAIPTDFRPWETMDANSKLAIEVGDAPFAGNPHVLKISTTAANAGASNPGWWGMGFRSETYYNLSFYAKTPAGQTDVNMYVTLSCPSGIVAQSGTFPVSGEWHKHSAQLWTKHACANGTLQVRVAESDASALVDHVSLFPSDAVAGLFRKDAFEYMQLLAAPVMRIPGGNCLEGFGPRTMWKWKHAIGVPEERSGHYNAAWGYWVTDGFGLPEMLHYIAALKTTPLLAVYSGYSMGAQYPPMNHSHAVMQDALDFLEYVNGSASTPWGAQRVLDGVPAALGEFSLEIGNEEHLMKVGDYPTYYKLISEAIWEKNNNIKIVASGYFKLPNHPDRSKMCFPCVGGCGTNPQWCDAWDEHAYGDDFDTLANLESAYDDYTTTCKTIAGGPCPPVNVLEYATRGADMEATLSEGLFLLGLERNSAIVRMSAYAPILQHVTPGASSWTLLGLNAAGVYAIPSFYMQKMLQKAQGTKTLDTTSVVDHSGIYNSTRWNASATTDGTATYVKVVNYGAVTLELPVTFSKEVTVVQTSALYGKEGKTAQNSFSNPKHVVPQAVSNPSTYGNVVLAKVPPYSFYVLEVKANSLVP